MFYSHLILTRKGPLGSVWIAATVGERSVSKRLAATAQIGKLCRSIQAPDAPFALRLSAQLMLGVTRIYARKSAIVLADTNALLNTLHRFSATYHNNDKKRKRDGDPSESIALLIQENTQDPFSLPPTNNFAKITLPLRKKRLLGQQAGRARSQNDLDAVDDPAMLSTMSTQSAHADNLAMFALPWEASQIPLDIEAALAMAFPSVKTEQVQLANSFSTNKEQSRSTYRAREQDITIPLSEQRHYFGDSEFVPSSVDRDDQVMGVESASLQSLQLDDPPSISGSASHLMRPSITINIQDNDAADELLIFRNKQATVARDGSGTTPAKRVLSTGKQESSSQYVIDTSHFKGYERVLLRTDHPADKRPGEHNIEPMNDAAHKLLSPSADSHLQVNESSIDAPNDNLALNATKFNSRAKRVGGLVLDIVTEFSESNFRSCFLDTSDILRRRQERHGINRAQSEMIPGINHSRVCFPMVGDIAPALQSLWENLIAGSSIDAWRRPTDPRSRILTDSSPSCAKHDSPESIQSLAAMEGDESASPKIGLGDKNILDDRLRGEQSDGHGDSVKTESKSDEVLAAEDIENRPENVEFENMEPEQQRHEDRRSIHDGGQTTSPTVRQLSFDGKVPNSNQISSDRRSVLLSHASLGSRASHGSGFESLPLSITRAIFEDTQSPDGTGTGSRHTHRVSLPEATFQLEEETEQPWGQSVREGLPCSPIEARTYRVLELLRGAVEPQSHNESNNRAQIITFDELSRGCSRAATARIFYHLTALATHEFVTVHQSAAYDVIHVYTGPRF